MGLIKAIAGAVGGTLADQWKEFFYCEAMDKDVLMTKGVNKISARRSSNKHGNENIISNGSGIAVADGQCMIIVEQGRIVEICSEPGEYTFDKSTEPSIFCGNLGKGIAGMFSTMWKRIGYGGDTGKDQRVYYFNLKELLDNKFGTMNPVPFRVVDSKIGLDIDVSVRCCGTFSYKISNPLLFYTNVAGNVADTYYRSNLDSQLKSEFISALQPAFGKLSAMEMRPNQIVAHTTDLENAMNEALSEKWRETRGLEIVSIALASVTLPKEDEDLIKNLQRQAVYKNAGMAGATLVEAQAEAMKNAANNPNGAMMGFMGLNMAQNAGGMNANNFYNMQAQQDAMAQQKAEQEAAARKQAEAQAAANGAWKCPQCGAMAEGKFCPECGCKKPEEAAGWKCPTCGAVNKGKFCAECGAKKPAGEPLYRCDKCGWEPKDPKNPPKFCPECGDPFGEEDIINK